MTETDMGPKRDMTYQELFDAYFVLRAERDALACKDCTWEHVANDLWKTSCKMAYWIEDGETPSDNEMIYCCYCGGKIIEATRKEGD